MLPIERRSFLKTSGFISLGMLMYAACEFKDKKMPVILLVSGWQDVNIGDIAHTPGLLSVLKTYIPQAKIILWKRSKSEDVERLLMQNFPEVDIIYGNVDSEKNVDSSSVTDAFEKADLMIHGSGPSVVGKTNLEAWQKHTHKPFGIFGVTIQSVDVELKLLLEKAAFIFTRETKSMAVLKENGLIGDHIRFAPDATFFMSIRNDQKASTFLQQNGLEEKSFICAIPRLRYTPYHKIRKSTNWSEEKIAQVESTNEKYKEQDHAKMRAALIWWVRETGKKVLICPEMTYEVDIMDELLIDPLPEDVKPFVLKRGYWLPDEAASVYRRSFAVLSFECHSPIMSLKNGTPAFYLRQPEDTIKGQMYYDLGYEDWVFEIEESSGEQITRQLQIVYENYKMAQQKVAESNQKVADIYQSVSNLVKQKLT